MNGVFFSGPQRVFQDSIKMLERIPNFDAIVGVPRSGTIVASFLATVLNSKLGFIDRSSGLVFFDGGYRVSFKSEVKSILLVDDVTTYANFVTNYKSFLKDYNVKTACIYINPGSEPLVDYFSLVVERPRIFSWNLFNNDLLSQSCVDLDGVLCFDPTEEENDDGENYLNFISNVKVKFRCRYEIHSIVTNRLEKYRNETELWLKRNNIKYRNLIMSPHKTKMERVKAKDYAIKKAEYFSKTNCSLFIESDEKQSFDIAKLSGKSVICSDKMVGFNTR